MDGCLQTVDEAVLKLMKPQQTPAMLNEIVKLFIVKLPPASGREICFIKLAPASVRKPGQGFTLSQKLANQEL
jgi:hypothetical protein